MQTLRAHGAMSFEDAAEAAIKNDSDSSPKSVVSQASNGSALEAPPLETSPFEGVSGDSLGFLENNLEAAWLQSSLAAFSENIEDGYTPFAFCERSFGAASEAFPSGLNEEELAAQKLRSEVIDALHAFSIQPNLPGSGTRGGAPSRSEHEKALTGVVIWPGDLDRPVSETLSRQSVYGNHLHKGVEEAAVGIMKGEIRCLLELWEKATQVRVTVPGSAVGDEFSKTRYDLSPTPGLTSFDYTKTPIRERYLFVKDRLLENERFKPTGILVELRVSGDLVDARGQTQRVALTQFSTGYDREKQAPNWEGTGPLLEPSIFHAGSAAIPDILLHASRLYEQAFQSPDDNVFRQSAAKIYWWLAHAMPDYRGSAAKTEIVYRAMHAARGLACPMWKPGVSADIEAMLRTEDQWLADYPGLQWSQQALEHAIANDSWR